MIFLNTKYSNNNMISHVTIPIAISHLSYWLLCGYQNNIFAMTANCLVLPSLLFMSNIEHSDPIVPVSSTIGDYFKLAMQNFIHPIQYSLLEHNAPSPDKHSRTKGLPIFMTKNMYDGINNITQNIASIDNNNNNNNNNNNIDNITTNYENRVILESIHHTVVSGATNLSSILMNNMNINDSIKEAGSLSLKHEYDSMVSKYFISYQNFDTIYITQHDYDHILDSVKIMLSNSKLRQNVMIVGSDNFVDYTNKIISQMSQKQNIRLLACDTDSLFSILQDYYHTYRSDNITNAMKVWSPYLSYIFMSMLSLNNMVKNLVAGDGYISTNIMLVDKKIGLFNRYSNSLNATINNQIYLEKLPHLVPKSFNNIFVFNSDDIRSVDPAALSRIGIVIRESDSDINKKFLLCRHFVLWVCNLYVDSEYYNKIDFTSIIRNVFENLMSKRLWNNEETINFIIQDSHTKIKDSFINNHQR